MVLRYRQLRCKGSGKKADPRFPGFCDVCGKRRPLKPDGTLETHFVKKKKERADG